LEPLTSFALHLQGAARGEEPSPRTARLGLADSISLLVTTKPTLLLAGLVHVIVTAIVFQHFFVAKFMQLDKTLPADATHYWQKRIVPPVLFALKHVLLLGMALLPLTMCRKMLAWLSTTRVNRYLPTDSLVSIHQFYGE
jgi:hypothetical protein